MRILCINVTHLLNYDIKYICDEVEINVVLGLDILRSKVRTPLHDKGSNLSEGPLKRVIPIFASSLDFFFIQPFIRKGPGWPSGFSDRPEKDKLGTGR